MQTNSFTCGGLTISVAPLPGSWYYVRLVYPARSQQVQLDIYATSIEQAARRALTCVAFSRDTSFDRWRELRPLVHTDPTSGEFLLVPYVEEVAA